MGCPMVTVYTSNSIPSAPHTNNNNNAIETKPQRSIMLNLSCNSHSSFQSLIAERTCGFEQENVIPTAFVSNKVTQSNNLMTLKQPCGVRDRKWHSATCQESALRFLRGH